ncbi:MAG: hypothetical protein ACLFPU_08030 [Dehalococcoidia bacterium]
MDFFTFPAIAGYNVSDAKDKLEMSLLYLSPANTGWQAYHSLRHR